MTGFRVTRGGAQELFSVLPDLTVWEKFIGGGMPVGAYGGRKDIMVMCSSFGNQSIKQALFLEILLQWQRVLLL